MPTMVNFLDVTLEINQLFLLIILGLSIILMFLVILVILYKKQNKRLIELCKRNNISNSKIRSA